MRRIHDAHQHAQRAPREVEMRSLRPRDMGGRGGADPLRDADAHDHRTHLHGP